jgi:hypothetical protein
MQSFRFKNLALALILAATVGFLMTSLSPAAYGQTIVSGDLTGYVTDSTNAVIVGASVTLTSDADASHRTVVTGNDGAYRFSLLPPGAYSVKVVAPGLVGAASHVAVNVGKASTVNIMVKPAAVAAEIIVDSSTQPLLQTEDANITTTVDARSIAQLPVPGGDISTLAFTAPGVNLSTGGGYGGFVAFGLPATSNLYTMNGNDIMDPYLNLNNSGASNLTLGANEIADVAIVNNGYDAQYGRYPGTQINYTTKSGTNQFHGDAQYFWNGRALNANDWINKNAGGKRPFANSNQWAGAVGGPIWRNKLFFFFDTEGMRYVLPGGGGLVKIPTTQFLSDVVANVGVVNPSEVNFYKTIQSLYNGASGAASATAMTTANCGTMEGVTLNGHLYGVGNSSCTRTFFAAVNNLNTEALWSSRVDQVLGANDHLSYRAHHDWGVQATGTDAINPAFNANSVQPEWEGQVNETHTFSSKLANNLIISGMYYKALFGPPDFAASTKVFPTTLVFTSSFANLGGTNYNYPNGRNVQQLQFVDDLSLQLGKHSVKFGLNYRWDKISDYTSQLNKTGSTTFKSLSDFANGQVSGVDTVSQAFPTVGQMPEIDPTFGVYAQDEWSVTDKLKLILSGRIDHNSNFWCPKNCFTRLSADFGEISHGASTPYNKSILTGQAHPFQSTDVLVSEPRFGFAYAPQGQGGRFSIRGGAGLFSDAPPGTLARRFLGNAPNVASFSYKGAGLVDPTLSSGSAYNFLAASASAFESGFSQGLTLAQIQANVAAKGSKYSAPSYWAAVDHFRTPQTAEWNLEAQMQVSRTDVFDFNYVGNHSWNTILVSNLDNAYEANGFGGLPTAAPDTRFGRVTEYTNNGKANYNGLTSSIRHQARYGLTLTANYTYSHALDLASNGGLEYFNGSNGSLAPQEQLSPAGSPDLNYGNADYDIRHSASVQYVWSVPVKATNAVLKPVIEGWGVSGNVFYRGGYPVSITNSSISVSNNTSTAFLAALVSGNDHSCAVKPNTADPTTPVCYAKDKFADASDLSTYKYGFGNIRRNSFSGPHYFNADLQLNKETKIMEKSTLKIGANFFNVLNHANFAPPTFDASAPDFGAIESTVTPPSSPYGSFMGSAVSGRVIQLLTSFTF